MALVRKDEHPNKPSLGTFLKPALYLQHARGELPKLVRSAFGGAALYNMKSLLKSGAQYSHEYCEHVCLHLDMEKKQFGKIFINPSWMILHTPGEII